MTATALQAPASYRNETPYPFCPGCGHGSVLDRLDAALARLGRDPSRVVIVSDIGCSGLSDQYFVTNAFHGLHGRSVTYASGIKLADPSLEVIVVMGDGGTGIGGTHLLNAARRNVGITVLVMNNLNFGMTGGQHSTTTPEGARTTTTPGGNLEHPLDICATVGVNGAAYVYRGTQWDEALSDRLVEAIQTPGFALLDVWELCTAYFVKANRFNRKAMEALMTDAGLRPGLLFRRDVAEYAEAYRRAHADDGPPAAARPIPGEYVANLDRPVSLVVAGGDPRRAVGRPARRLPGHRPDRTQPRRAGPVAHRAAAHHGVGPGRAAGAQPGRAAPGCADAGANAPRRHGRHRPGPARSRDAGAGDRPGSGGGRRTGGQGRPGARPAGRHHGTPRGRAAGRPARRRARERVRGAEPGRHRRRGIHRRSLIDPARRMLGPCG
jgi:pyruvate/2-oxoacid:ferredoxin oxidoreductase beta subunit